MKITISRHDGSGVTIETVAGSYDDPLPGGAVRPDARTMAETDFARDLAPIVLAPDLLRYVQALASPGHDAGHGVPKPDGDVAALSGEKGYTITVSMSPVLDKVWRGESTVE